MKPRIAIPLALAAALYLAPLSAGAADESSDAWLTTKSKLAVFGSIGTTGTRVHVDSNEGLVTLHGTVSTSKEKGEAEKSVAKLDGVKKVRNLLEVVEPKKQDAVAATDADIEKDAKAALRDDDVLKDETGIKIDSVNKGTVVLSGNAASLSNHLRAVEDVRAVPGVKRVASTVESPDSKAVRKAAMKPGSDLGKVAKGDMSDKPGKLSGDAKAEDKSSTAALTKSASDAYITTKAKARLLVDSKTPGTAINVDTKDGVVTLFGTVADEATKKKAEAEVSKVDGVKDVENEIEIVAASVQDKVSKIDTETERGVKKAVAADKALADASISVQVENGVARLTGTAPSESLRKEAEKITKRADGVKSVRNEIEVSRD